MNRYPDLARLLGVGFRQRLRRIYGGLRRDLYLDAWFPHIPLAVAIALFGLLKISPALSRALGLHLFSAALTAQSAAQVHSVLNRAGRDRKSVV